MSGINYETVRLDNGANFCFIEVDQARSVRLGIGFPYAGDYYSSPPETGHVVEHMIFTGAASAANGQFLGTAQAFRQAIERNGSVMGARTYPEHMTYSLVSPARGCQEAVDSFVRGIEAPLFDATELQTELEVVRGELINYTNSDSRILRHELMQTIGRDEPDPMQIIAQLGSISPDDLREHHRRTHSTEGMYVVVSGPPDIDKEFIRQRFAHIELEARAPEPCPAPALVQPEQPVLVEKDISNVYYMLGRYGMDTLSYPMSTYAHLLEGWLFQYQNAAIYEGVRDAGLAYNIAGNIKSDEYGKDMFLIDGEVPTDNAPTLWRFVRDKLHHALNPMLGITPQEFEEVRENTIGRFDVRYEDVANVHTLAMNHLRRYRTFYHPNDMVGRLERATFDNYQRTIRQLFTGGVAVAGAIGKNLQQQPELVAALQETQNFFRSI